MKVLILTKAFVSHVNSDFLKENWMGDLSGDVFLNRFVVPFASWKLLNWIFSKFCEALRRRQMLP